MKRVVIVFLVFLVGIIIIWFASNQFEVSTPDKLTYEGLWVSFYGVALTFFQVLKLKGTAAATERAINETKTQMKLVLSVAQVAKNTSELRYVKECVTNGKMELARLRLGDVKDFMSAIGFIDDIDYDKSIYKKLVNTLESNLNSLEQEINKTQSLDKNVFSKDIEKVVSFLMEVENKLKSK